MAMKDGGHLRTGEVVSFTHHVVGEETGFLGEIAILSLTYSSDAAAQSFDAVLPKTMVLKIPTSTTSKIGAIAKTGIA